VRSPTDALLYDGDVDTRGRQPFDVIAAQFRIHDVESLLPCERPSLMKGQEDAYSSSRV